MEIKSGGVADFLRPGDQHGVVVDLAQKRSSQCQSQCVGKDGTVEGLAAAIHALAADVPALVEMGRRGREQVMTYR